jgi:hypothetical protein
MNLDTLFENFFNYFQVKLQPFNMKEKIKVKM